MLSFPCFSGLVYFVFKYMVDKYNLLYAYQNISASGRQYLHQTAMRFVIMALISLQLATLFFTLVRGAGNTHAHTHLISVGYLFSGGGLSPRAIFLIVTIVLTTVCCFAVLALGWLSFLLPQVQTRFNIKVCRHTLAGSIPSGCLLSLSQTGFQYFWKFIRDRSS